MTVNNNDNITLLSNMADAAAARREARRRRILENSHNRLQRIAGKIEDERPTDLTIFEQNYETPIASASTSHSSHCYNGVIVSEPESYELPSVTLNSHLDIDAAGDGDIVEDVPLLNSFTNLAVPTVPLQEPVPNKPLLVKLTANKYDIVLLSLFIQLLHCLSFITFEDSYFFLPLIIYIVTKLIWFPTQSNNSNIANALLLLNGMAADRVQKILSAMQYSGVIASDVSVFLFTTICVQSLCQLLKESFVT